jgi:hypothetical protein
MGLEAGDNKRRHAIESRSLGARAVQLPGAIPSTPARTRFSRPLSASKTWLQIVGLTMALGLDDGFSEPVFALAFVVSCIVRLLLRCGCARSAAPSHAAVAACR